jgi:Co/Zn/Cd efflux system component
MIHRNYEIDADIMLYTSIFALCSNLIMMKILHGGHGHSHGGHSHGGHGAHDEKDHGHSHNKKKKG